MGFSFDFAGERNVIVYETEEGMVLDENMYSMLRSEIFEESVLPFEIENTSKKCCIYYDITGCTNMRAWMGEVGFLEKRKMKKKIEETQKFLVQNGIPKEMIEQEMQYMFVNNQDEEVRLVCVPVRESMYTESKRGRSMDTGLPPLPKEIPVPPESGAGFKNYSKFSKAPKQNEDNWNIEEELYVSQDRHVEQDIEPLQKVDDLQKIEEIEPIDSLSEEERFSEIAEDFIQDDRDFLKEETVKNTEKPEEESEEEGTVLLYNPDDEGTVLLKVPPKINARLIRRSTGEEFVINKERNKIGKKAAVVDICLQGNKTISREHCIITFEEGEFFLEDCNSLNHTYLNKTQLEPETPVKLETDSEIQMSDELFDFIIEEG